MSRDLETAATQAGPTARSQCVTEDELVALGCGELAPERVDEIVAHVDRCPACAEVVATLGKLDTARDVGRYQLGRVLGSGAMGIVYEAWDPQLRRRVALKIVRPERADAAAHDRMLREARALARISHPNVVAIYDVEDHRGTVCVATELVDGETLATWQRGRPVEQLVDAWIQAARGLAAAHAGGVVHRDVKPANVFIGKDGRVRVGDFGIARLGDDTPHGDAAYTPPTPDDNRVTATGMVAGTPAYMAPEQARGAIDARSDQFAVCVALAEAITGERPAAGATGIVADRPALAAALERGLAEDPAARFASIDDLATALAAAIAPPPRRNRKLIALAAGALALAGGTIAWLARPRAESCELPQIPAGLWSAARRASVAAHAPASVQPRIDRYLASWSDARDNVCAVERDNPTLRMRRERCEVDQLRQLDRMLARWEHAGRVLPMIAHQDFEDLPLAPRCSHDAQLHVPEPSLADQVRISGIRAALELARDQEPRLHALFADARELGDPVLVVEIATALVEHQDHEAAARTWRDTIAVADASGAELPAIDARIALLGISDSRPPADVDELADTARMLIAKIGGNAELDARLDHVINLIETSRGRDAEALAAADRAQRAAQLAWGPDSGHEVISLISIYVAQHDEHTRTAARDKALAINQRAGLGLPIRGAVTIGTDPEGFIANMKEMVESARQLYPDSTALAASELDLAKAYFLAGHPAAAVPVFEEAIDLAERHGVHDTNLLSGYVMYAHTLTDLRRTTAAAVIAERAVVLAQELDLPGGLGEALVERAASKLATDRRSARADLEQAQVALERGQASSATRAHAAFLLALALYPDDPKAAIALATSARSDLERLISALSASDPQDAHVRVNKQAELDEIVAWLATHK